MALSTEGKERIMSELEGLPSDKVKEVLDFIGYLKIKELSSGVDVASLILQQRGLAKIWEGEEEALYAL
ncbi:hypothetical protein KAX17_17370 [Candidatus Bipolaricaulota bacterium]|nr:hypothetical protein [Candidatus Bipolaricaulota bacterium]